MQVKQTGLTRRDHILLSIVIIAFISFFAFLDANDYYDKSKLTYRFLTYERCGLENYSLISIASFTGDTVKGMQVYAKKGADTPLIISLKTQDDTFVTCVAQQAGP